MGIRIDYSKDDKRVRDLKRVYSDLIKMKQLKEHNLWWDDSEESFVKKYKLSSSDKEIDLWFKKLEEVFDVVL